MQTPVGIGYLFYSFKSSLQFLLWATCCGGPQDRIGHIPVQVDGVGTDQRRYEWHEDLMVEFHLYTNTIANAGCIQCLRVIGILVKCCDGDGYSAGTTCDGEIDGLLGSVSHTGNDGVFRIRIDGSIQSTFLGGVTKLNELEEGDTEFDDAREQVQKDDEADRQFYQALSSFSFAYEIHWFTTFHHGMDGVVSESINTDVHPLLASVIIIRSEVSLF